MNNCRTIDCSFNTNIFEWELGFLTFVVDIKLFYTHESDKYVTASVA